VNFRLTHKINTPKPLLNEKSSSNASLKLESNESDKRKSKPPLHEKSSSNASLKLESNESDKRKALRFRGNREATPTISQLDDSKASSENQSKALSDLMSAHAKITEQNRKLEASINAMKKASKEETKKAMDEFQRKFKDDAKKASKERQKELAILNGRATKERKQLLNRNADLERTINMNKEVAARAQLDLQTEVAGLNLTIKQYMDKEKVIIFILRYCILIANVNR